MKKYFYGYDNSIIAKDVNGEPKMLTKKEIKDLIKKKERVAESIVKYGYFSVDCDEKCSDCHKEIIDFISLSSYSEVVDTYIIRGICKNCFGDYLSSLNCGGFPIIYTLGKVKNGWVDINDHNLPKEKTYLYDDHKFIENYYYKDFNVVIDDIIPNICNFIVQKFKDQYEKELINFVHNEYTIKMPKKDHYKCYECSNNIQRIIGIIRNNKRVFDIRGYCNDHIYEEIYYSIDNNDKIWNEITVYSSLYEYVGKQCELKKQNKHVLV